MEFWFVNSSKSYQNFDELLISNDRVSILALLSFLEVVVLSKQLFFLGRRFFDEVVCDVGQQRVVGHKAHHVITWQFLSSTNHFEF